MWQWAPQVSSLSFNNAWISASPAHSLLDNTRFDILMSSWNFTKYLQFQSPSNPTMDPHRLTQPRIIPQLKPRHSLSLRKTRHLHPLSKPSTRQKFKEPIRKIKRFNMMRYGRKLERDKPPQTSIETH